jgi:hypothetical protein
MYGATALGFYLFAGVSHWSKYERHDLDVAVLKDFLAHWKVHGAFALLFGFFGPILNLDTVNALGTNIRSVVLGAPDVMPVFRCFVVGLGGPLAASKLFSLAGQRREGGSAQVDDVVHQAPGRKTFWEEAKELLLI